MGESRNRRSPRRKADAKGTLQDVGQEKDRRKVLPSRVLSVVGVVMIASAVLFKARKSKSPTYGEEVLFSHEFSVEDGDDNIVSLSELFNPVSENDSSPNVESEVRAREQTGRLDGETSTEEPPEADTTSDIPTEAIRDEPEQIVEASTTENPSNRLRCNLKPNYRKDFPPIKTEVQSQAKTKRRAPAVPTTMVHDANTDPGFTPFNLSSCTEASNLQQHQKENGNYQLALFYHVGVLNNWVDIVCDQMKAIEQCGIGSILSHLSVSYSNGPKDEVSQVMQNFDFAQGTNLTTDFVETTTAPWEGNAMRDMSKYCRKAVSDPLKTNQTTIVFYLHNKGVSWYKDDWRDDMKRHYSYLYVLYWRKYMEYFTTQHPQWCIDAILHQGAKTCGVKMRYAGRGNWQYSGNFWVASCEFIASLEPIPLDEKDYYAAENWLGIKMGDKLGLNRTEFVSFHDPVQDRLYDYVIKPEDYIIDNGAPRPVMEKISR